MVVHESCVICGEPVTGYRAKTTCSGRSCRGKLAARNSNQARPTKSDETIRNIVRMRRAKASSYFIAETLGISRNTVMKYWNG